MIMEGPCILEVQFKTGLAGSAFRRYCTGEGRWTSLVLVLVPKSSNVASCVWFSKALDPIDPAKRGVLKSEMLHPLLQGTINILLRG